MPLKILIVDDSATDRLLIQKMLGRYNVITASNGFEAMRQIEEHKDIDLVILDLNMPGMDGFQVLGALKSDDRFNRIRTIILTNYDELDNEIRGLQLGAVDYIRKPIHMDSLTARIEIHAELLRIQQALEQKLHEQGLTFETIFNQAPIGIAVSHNYETLTEEQNRYFNVNPMFEKISGRNKEELLRLGWAGITHPDDLEENVENYKRLKAGEIESYAMDKRLIKPDGSVVWVHMIVASLGLSNEHQYNHVCLVQDITERKTIEKALQESERSKSVLLSHLPGLAYRCSYDRDWTMQYVSAGCLNLTGYPPESLLFNKDLSYNDIIAPEYRELIWEEWGRVISRRIPFKYEYEIITAYGERKWVLEMGEGVFDEQGHVEAVEGIVIDITDRKEMEDKLKYSYEHDRRTDLYNLIFLEGLLNGDARKKTDERRALVGINLSAVQSITMTYGYHYTLDLIKRVADALTKHCTDRRMLFSTYEHQFAFYLKGYQGKSELFEFCDDIAKTLQSLLTMERIVGGIGIAEIDPDKGWDADRILQNLLIASERAMATTDKEFGISLYDEELEKHIIRKTQIKNELTCIASCENDGGLYLQYQPVLDLKTGRISGFEALSRLNSSKLGRVPPLEFIPLAEETKLIIPIGMKVFRQALSFLIKLKENGYENINVSVNVSVIQLLAEDFTKNLFEMIDRMGVNPANVALEITESVFASDFEQINRVLGILKDAGLSIAIDDFGTGYSSLSREWEMNINCLKIDKAFIDNLLLHDPSKAIIGDIVSMAQRFGHCVIAEGVEHESQKQYLIGCGCDKIQGYLISKPLDEEDAIEILKRINDHP